jgi:hypothetical protein
MSKVSSCLRRMTRHPTIVLLAAIVLNASTATAQSPLGSAQSFAVLGATTVTNTGATVVTGNLGVSPGTASRAFLQELCWEEPYTPVISSPLRLRLMQAWRTPG